MRRDPQILVPRYVDLELRDMDPIRMGRMGGRWRIDKFKACGRNGLGEVPGTRRTMLDIPNIITDKGLNLRGDSVDGPLGGGGSSYIHCGEGNATPTVADTALQTHTASNLTDANVATHVWWSQTTAPYYSSHRIQTRFAAGFAGGAVNITELGIGPDATNTNMFSRVLTLDAMGLPAAVPIDADEAFDVFYTLENYPDHVTSDGTGTVDISGTNYDYTIRAAYVTTAAEWGRNVHQLHSGNYNTAGATAGKIETYGSDATLGAITSEPAATSVHTMDSNGDNIVDATYVTDTFQRKITYVWGLTEGNVTGNIKAMRLGSTWGTYQLLWDTVIPKTSSNTLSFPLTTTWSRHV